MNYIDQTVKQMINLHGINCIYTSVITGEYDLATGTVTNNSSNYNVKMYMRHLKQNQFSYPDLVGKDAAMFYVSATDLVITPKVQDLIVYAGKTYKVDSFQSHAALGSVLMYRIIGVV